jgi:hypothetical protein
MNQIYVILTRNSGNVAERIARLSIRNPSYVILIISDLKFLALKKGFIIYINFLELVPSKTSKYKLPIFTEAFSEPKKFNSYDVIAIKGITLILIGESYKLKATVIGYYDNSKKNFVNINDFQNLQQQMKYLISIFTNKLLVLIIKRYNLIATTIKAKVFSQKNRHSFVLDKLYQQIAGNIRHG